MKKNHNTTFASSPQCQEKEVQKNKNTGNGHAPDWRRQCCHKSILPFFRTLAKRVGKHAISNWIVSKKMTLLLQEFLERTEKLTACIAQSFSKILTRLSLNHQFGVSSAQELTAFLFQKPQRREVRIDRVFENESRRSFTADYEILTRNPECEKIACLTLQKGRTNRMMPLKESKFINFDASLKNKLLWR
jgi:hypothetical protein